MHSYNHHTVYAECCILSEHFSRQWIAVSVWAKKNYLGLGGKIQKFRANKKSTAWFRDSTCCHVIVMVSHTALARTGVAPYDHLANQLQIGICSQACDSSRSFDVEFTYGWVAKVRSHDMNTPTYYVQSPFNFLFACKTLDPLPSQHWTNLWSWNSQALIYIKKGNNNKLNNNYNNKQLI